MLKRIRLFSNANLILLEGFAVLSLLSLFLALILSYPKLLSGLITVDALFWDQFMATEILTLLKKESFWRLLVTGQLPCSRLAYHSVLMAYVYIPFHLLFEGNWWVVRFWHLLFVLPTLGLTYLLARDISNKKMVGLLVLLLLVIHPGYIAGMRLGPLMQSHMQFFSVSALYFLVRWSLTKKKLFLCLGMLAAGLGMSTLLWFYWFWVGLATVGFLFAPEAIAEYRYKPREFFKTTVLALSCLGIGCFLLIYREIVHQFAGTFWALSAGFNSANNNAVYYYFQRLPETFGLINGFLSLEHWMIDDAYVSPGLFHFVKNEWFLPVLWTSTAALLVMAFSRPGKKRLLIFPCIFLVMCLLAPISSEKPFAHLFLLYPFPQLVIGLAFAEFLSLVQRSRWTKAALAVGLVVFAFKEVSGLASVFEEFKSKRAPEVYSEADVDLMNWFRKSGKHPINVFSIYNSGPRLHPELFIFHERMSVLYLDLNASSRELFDEFLTTKGEGWFVEYAKKGESRPLPEYLSGWIAEIKRQPPQVFVDFRGEPIYKVYSVSRDHLRSPPDLEVKRPRADARRHTDETAIRNKIAELTRSLHGGSVKTIVDDLMSKDTWFLGAWTERFEFGGGKMPISFPLKSVETELQGRLAGPLKGKQHTCLLTRLRFPKPDTALVNMTYTARDSSGIFVETPVFAVLQRRQSDEGTPSVWCWETLLPMVPALPSDHKERASVLDGTEWIVGETGTTESTLLIFEKELFITHSNGRASLPLPYTTREQGGNIHWSCNIQLKPLWAYNERGTMNFETRPRICMVGGCGGGFEWRGKISNGNMTGTYVYCGHHQSPNWSTLHWNAVKPD